MTVVVVVVIIVAVVVVTMVVVVATATAAPDKTLVRHSRRETRGVELLLVLSFAAHTATCTQDDVYVHTRESRGATEPVASASC